MTRLEKLLMRVELIDQVTGPANKLMGSIDKLTSRSKVGFANMATGAAGLFGIGYTLNALTSDARNFQNAVREVSSLGVAKDALDQLESAGLKFSIAYGESAADFVRSSYDIQSAVSSLRGDELSKFTEAGNLLAKGTKSDAATITNFMGTMYGIFKDTANAMGKSRWVQILAGQTATAVEMFKTTGSGMSDAFKALGADAQAQGIALADQMAVMGTLQSTMGGSESGTKFRAFLVGIGNAEKQLGVSLTDSAGKMLPIVDVLDRIKAKVGGLGNVARGSALKKAFGSDEAVAFINLLMNDTKGLSESIQKLGSVNGMDKARMMAAAMIDPLDRLAAANTAVRISFGKVITQAMTPFYDSSIDALSTLNRWIVMFPHITKLVAILTIAFLGFSAAVAMFAIAKGIYIVAATGITTALAVLRFALLPFGPLLSALRFAWLIFNIQLAAGAGLIPALRVAFVALRTQFLINAAAVWAFNAALLANPITWIVLGVVALIAGLVLLVTHWDTVKKSVGDALNWITEKWSTFRSAIENTTVLKFLFQPLLSTVDLISFVIEQLGNIPEWFAAFTAWLVALNPMQGFSNGLDFISEKWKAFRAYLEDNAFLKLLFLPLTSAVDGVDLLLKALEKVPAWFAEFKKWLQNLDPFSLIKKLDDGLVDLLNKIPGVHLQKSESSPAPAYASDTTSVQSPAMQGVMSMPGVNTPVVKTPTNFVERAATPEKVQQPFLLAQPPQAAPVVNLSPQLNQPAPVVNLSPQLTQPAPVVNLSPQLTQPAPVVNLSPQLTQPAPVVNVPAQVSQPAPVVKLAPQLSQPAPVVNVPQPLKQPAPLVNLPAQLNQPAAINNVIQLPRAVEQGNQVENANTLEATTNARRTELVPQKVNIAQHVPTGGLRDQITNSDNSKTVNIEKLEVNTSQLVNGYSLVDELKMVGG